jgi:hypothetical protein
MAKQASMDKIRLNVDIGYAIVRCLQGRKSHEVLLTPEWPSPRKLAGGFNSHPEKWFNFLLFAT